MQPHRLPPLTVQAHLIACALNGGRAFPAGLRLATGSAEHQGIPVREPEEHQLARADDARADAENWRSERASFRQL